MKMRRTLNLLAAAAGLVFLTGCATETLTDSAFWTYLPFTSSKGGQGSGGHGTGAKPKTAPDSPTTKPTDQPNAATVPQRSTDPAAEGWNDPVKPSPEVTSVTKPQTVGTDDAGPKPTPRLDTSDPKPKSTPVGIPLRTELPTATSKIPGAAPTLPSVDGHSPDVKNTGTISLPQPAIDQTKDRTTSGPGFGDSTVPASIHRPGSNQPSLPELPEPTVKGKRTPIRLPELFVDGIGPATVGKPTIAELPKRTVQPLSGDSLKLPREVLGEPAAASPAQATRRIPRAITDDPKRPAANTASLPLPAIPADAPKNGPSQAFAPGAVLGQPNTATANLGGPSVAIPGAPATKPTDGRTLTGGVAGGPLPAKPNGDPTPLPNVGPLPPLPPPPIPTPFRLSEWISNDALHQAWRRRQSERTQFEPEIRGSEQQRLRLLLDTYLLREKPEAKPEK